MKERIMLVAFVCCKFYRFELVTQAIFLSFAKKFYRFLSCEGKKNLPQIDNKKFDVYKISSDTQEQNFSEARGKIFCLPLIFVRIFC